MIVHTNLLFPSELMTLEIGASFLTVGSINGQVDFKEALVGNKASF